MTCLSCISFAPLPSLAVELWLWFRDAVTPWLSPLVLSIETLAIFYFLLVVERAGLCGDCFFRGKPHPYDYINQAQLQKQWNCNNANAHAPEREKIMPGIWQGLVNLPQFNTSTMILLTDGRIMVQEEAQKHWHALTPDGNGSYVNGTWSTLKDMSFWRRYYASGTLKDGRVIIIGGEQSGDVGDTNKGEIYDPVADTWTPIPSPTGWPQVGDASSCILPDGRLMIGALDTPECIIYEPVANAWTPAASKAVRSNEESWVL